MNKIDSERMNDQHRLRLRDSEINFVLRLLRKEKAEVDREFADHVEETRILESLFYEWRRKFVRCPSVFFDGYKYIKNRLQHLGSRLDYYRYTRAALQEQINHYEAALRGKPGRMPNVSVNRRGYHLNQVLRMEEMNP